MGFLQDSFIKINSDLKNCNNFIDFLIFFRNYSLYYYPILNYIELEIKKENFNEEKHIKNLGYIFSMIRERISFLFVRKLFNTKNNPQNHFLPAQVKILEELLNPDEKAEYLFFILYILQLKTCKEIYKYSYTKEGSSLKHLFLGFVFEALTQYPILASVIKNDDEFLFKCDKYVNILNLGREEEKKFFKNDFKIENFKYFKIGEFEADLYILAHYKYMRGLLSESTVESIQYFNDSVKTFSKLINFFMSDNVYDISSVEDLYDNIEETNNKINFKSIINFLNTNIKNLKSQKGFCYLLNYKSNYYLIILPFNYYYFYPYAYAYDDFIIQKNKFNSNPLEYINNNFDVINQSRQIISLIHTKEKINNLRLKGKIYIEIMKFIRKSTFSIALSYFSEWLCSNILNIKNNDYQLIIKVISFALGYPIDQLFELSKSNKKNN